MNMSKNFAISGRYAEKHFAISDNGIANRLCVSRLILSIAFGVIMGAAQHLAVVNRCRAAVTPGAHMVGIHLAQFPEACVVGIMADCTQWAVADSGTLSRFGLLAVYLFLCRLVKDTHIQQASVVFATQYVLEDAFAVLDI